MTNKLPMHYYVQYTFFYSWLQNFHKKQVSCYNAAEAWPDFSSMRWLWGDSHIQRDLSQAMTTSWSAWSPQTLLVFWSCPQYHVYVFLSYCLMYDIENKVSYHMIYDTIWYMIWPHLPSNGKSTCKDICIFTCAMHIFWMNCKTFT